MSLLRVELRKLGAQGGIQVLFAVCAFAPMVLAIVLGVQDGLPKDTLFGRYVKESGFALPLLVLGFAGLWGFPLLAGLVTGQVFAGEDAHGTWQLLLTRSRTRAQVFRGKVLAASLTVLALLVTAAVSSLASGLALSGDRALVDLSGGEVGGGIVRRGHGDAQVCVGRRVGVLCDHDSCRLLVVRAACVTVS